MLRLSVDENNGSDKNCNEESHGDAQDHNCLHPGREIWLIHIVGSPWEEYQEEEHTVSLEKSLP